MNALRQFSTDSTKAPGSSPRTMLVDLDRRTIVCAAGVEGAVSHSKAVAQFDTIALHTIRSEDRRGGAQVDSGGLLIANLANWTFFL
jgi:hypothetical protein